jgi:mono/diheme cytochrome c family protein
MKGKVNMLESIRLLLKSSARLTVAAIIPVCFSQQLLAEDELLVSDEPIVNAGYHTYVAKCAICHGDDGKGDGPYAPMLTTRPADLTVLSKNNNGEFPFWEAYETISGSELLPAHGNRHMPIWGEELSEEAAGMDKATFVRGRILGIIAYLQHIQEK